MAGDTPNPHASEGYDRVRAHSASIVNDRIDRETEGSLAQLERLDEAAVHRRLAELDREWDIDRAMMANFAVVGGAAFTAGLTRHRGWLWMFGAQLGFLMLHALNGWCPPASLFRRLGFRTRGEIDAERYALHRMLERRTAAHEYEAV